MARIVVTRPVGQEAELVARLRGLGHEVFHRPLIAVEPLGHEPIDLDGYDWVVVTSPNGARELLKRARGRPARSAAIGQATADALGGADLVPRVSTQEGLLAELPRPPGTVLVAGAEGARRVIADELGADFLALYRTVELRCDLPTGLDFVVLSSASQARALGRIGSAAPVISIGPETTRAARETDLRVAAEAETHDLEGLVAAVEHATRPG